MSESLLTLALETRRDLWRARQLARHVALLFGLDPYNQRCLAAGVFDLACRAFAPTKHAMVSFEIAGDSLHISCKRQTPFPRVSKEIDEHSRNQTAANISLAAARHKAQSSEKAVMRLSIRIPSSGPVARHDVSWVLTQLAQLAPVDVLDEMTKLNQELLQALVDQGRQNQLDRQSAIAA